MPWVKVEKNYVFDTASGKKTLADLFGRKSQLIVSIISCSAPGWEEGCKSCSYLARSFRWQPSIHLAHRDVTLMAVSRAPIERDRSVPETHGLALSVGVVVWKRVSITTITCRLAKEERATGKVYYNYSKRPSSRATKRRAPACSIRTKTGGVYPYLLHLRARAGYFGGYVYNFLDLAPKGRDEEGLKSSMAWLRHHDKYADDELLDLSLALRNGDTK
jgi:predicted dithiol-disulfide oxidoreductase (DUF899 family)